MAKKRVTKPQQSVTTEQIEAALRQKDFSGALAMLTIASRIDPPLESSHNYHALLMRLATEAIYDAPRSTLNSILKELDAIPSTDPNWLRQRAMLHARCGNLSVARELATTPESQAELLGHLVDRAVRLQLPEILPEGQKATYESYLRSYRLYMEGKDEESLQEMQGIGLTSPFLEWKVLLRGMIAYSKNESPRAVENWKRLNPARLPYRLARPLQFNIDPASLPSGTVEEKTHFQKSMQVYTDTDLVKGLRRILTGLAKDRKLQPVWPEVETVAPILKQKHPDLIPRLGHSMYWAIIRQGEPRDMTRFKRFFGEPHDDPRFHRLEGIILEEMQELGPAIEAWQKYEKWLASKPAGWSPAMLDRARALILFRIAEMVEKYSLQDEEDFFIDNLLPDYNKKKRSKSKPKFGNVEKYYRECMGLAPNWIAPAICLIGWYVESDKEKEAKALGESYLQRFPKNIHLLQLMAEVEQLMGNKLNVRHYNERLMAANPLDRTIRKRVAKDLISDAHALLMDQPEAVDTYLLKHQQLCHEAVPAYYYAMRWVWARKQKNQDLQDILHESVSPIPGTRLAYLFCRSVYAAYLLSTPEKTALRSEWKKATKMPPLPLEVARLCEAWIAFNEAEFKYVGQKTLGKEILSLAKQSTENEFVDADGEALMEVLRVEFSSKQVKPIVDYMVHRKPDSAPLLIHWLEVYLDLGQHHNMLGTCRKHYEKAKQLIEQMPVSEQKPYQARLAEILPLLRSPESIFDSLFEHLRNRL